MMQAIQKDVFQMINVLPSSSLISLKPLLSDLLTGVILMNDPTANISDMDDYDKILFLESLNKLNNDNYLTFEDALTECGLDFDELYNIN